MRRKQKEDLKGNIFIGIGLLVVCFLFYMFLTKNTVEYNELTGCEKVAGPNNYYVIILDNTEGLRSNQKIDVRKKIKGILTNTDPNDKVLIYSLQYDSSIGNFVPLIDICSLRDGLNADEWIENPTKIRNKRLKNFDTPIDEAIDKMTSIGIKAKNSPIFELIQHIRTSNLPDDFGNKSIEINLFSDLLQHSKNLSFYKPIKIKKFLESKEFELIRSDLSGIDLIIWHLTHQSIDNVKMIDHWYKIISKMNGIIQKVERISG